MEDSIFTKIIKGEIPSYKVYEDEYTYVFLDIHPIHRGQVLVVPKQQIDFVWNMDPITYQAVMMTVQKVGRRLQDVFPEEARVGAMIEGLDVANHAHVKVFPFSSADEYRHVPDMTTEPDHEALKLLAEKLAF